MPTSRRREDEIIELFVSAYEDDAWKDSHVHWLDHVADGPVEALVTRPDGKTLAIEHTLIESFVGEREDLERSKIFQDIEGDPAPAAGRSNRLHQCASRCAAEGHAVERHRDLRTALASGQSRTTP